MEENQDAPMEENEHYWAKIKKPISIQPGVVEFTDSSMRFGSMGKWAAVKWEYEIPFSEIAELTHQAVRGNVYGKLKDGSELSFRIQSQMNPMKDLRASNAMDEVLSKVQPEGSSVKRLDDGTAAAEASGCGCLIPIVAALATALMIAIVL